MSQLKNDCFALGTNLVKFDYALGELEKITKPVVDVEKISIDSALMRILAEDIISDRNVPPHDNSAVDGYAVSYDDLSESGETSLLLAEHITAGHPLVGSAMRGKAYRIFTGAKMPIGSDTVFMQEDVFVDENKVTVPAGINLGANRRLLGEDVAEGTTILKRGQRLRPQEIGLLASVGLSEISVYKKLRVCVFSTGDEIYDPSGDAPDGCIFDANRFTVINSLRGLGCQVTDLGILKDDEQTIRNSLEEAAVEHDLMFTSGGVSVGDGDHIKSAVESLGSIYFWRLAIKPGRPIAFGQVLKTPFVGLPGNPVAAMVTFIRIARFIVLRLSGVSDDIHPKLYRVFAGFDFSSRGGRREWLRAQLKVGNNGDLYAHLFPAKGSGILSSMVNSSGLVEIGEEMSQIRNGDLVNFLPFNEIYT